MLTTDTENITILSTPLLAIDQTGLEAVPQDTDPVPESLTSVEADHLSTVELLEEEEPKTFGDYDLLPSDIRDSSQVGIARLVCEKIPLVALREGRSREFLYEEKKYRYEQDSTSLMDYKREVRSFINDIRSVGLEELVRLKNLEDTDEVAKKSQKKWSNLLVDIGRVRWQEDAIRYAIDLQLRKAERHNDVNTLNCKGYIYRLVVSEPFVELVGKVSELPYVVQRCCPHEFDLDNLETIGEPQEFISWLGRRIGHDTVRTLQQDLGAALAGTARQAIYLEGPTGCGKTQLLNILDGVLGGDSGYLHALGKSVLTTTGAFVSENNINSQLAQARGSKFLTLDETSANSYLDETTFKMLTSGGKISARHLGEDAEQMRSSFTPVICTNVSPSFQTFDEAGLVRLHHYDFSALTEEDIVELGVHSTFADYIVSREGEKIFYWLLRGWMDQCQNGRFESDAYKAQQSQKVSDAQQHDTTSSFFEEYRLKLIPDGPCKEHHLGKNGVRLGVLVDLINLYADKNNRPRVKQANVFKCFREEGRRAVVKPRNVQFVTCLYLVDFDEQPLFWLGNTDDNDPNSSGDPEARKSTANIMLDEIDRHLMEFPKKSLPAWREEAIKRTAGMCQNKEAILSDKLKQINRGGSTLAHDVNEANDEHHGDEL